MYILAVEKVEALALDAGVLVLTAQINPVLSLQTSVLQTCKPDYKKKPPSTIFAESRNLKKKLIDDDAHEAKTGQTRAHFLFP